MLEMNTMAVAEGMVKRLLPRSADARVVYVTSEMGSGGLRSDPTCAYDGVGEAADRTSKAAMNMLAACQHVEDGPRGVKVWAFNPGYVVTGLSRTGEKGRQGGGIEGRGMRG
jgi:NAD(P)-dependent dehydrogenase (short-subunit alcohol dehydrogenase family)